MKEFLVKDAAGSKGKVITSFFVVMSKEVRTRRDGGAYVQFLLADRTGLIQGKLWEKPELGEPIQPDQHVKVEGRINEYQQRLEIAITRLRIATAEEVDPADFLPASSRSIDIMWAELAEIIERVENLQIRRLLRSFYEDEGIAPGLRRSPAAKSYHHAFLGGLLEHVISLCRLCELVQQNYPWLSRDLLWAGAILHDIGKIHELTCERSINYTVRGELLGHIALGLEMLHAKIETLGTVSSELATVLEHLVLSHHGELQYGSPVEPATAESLVFHFLDDLDAKLAALAAGFSQQSSGLWTDRIRSLDRRFLRIGSYLDVNGSSSS